MLFAYLSGFWNFEIFDLQVRRTLPDILLALMTILSSEFKRIRGEWNFISSSTVEDVWKIYYTECLLFFMFIVLFYVFVFVVFLGCYKFKIFSKSIGNVRRHYSVQATRRCCGKISSDGNFDALIKIYCCCYLFCVFFLFNIVVFVNKLMMTWQISLKCVIKV